jgi:acyl-CoA thioesterase II
VRAFTHQPVGCGPVDAQTFLGMEPVGDNLHWQMRVQPQLTTPGNFLFGGCALGAALVALETASGRSTVWATAQYLSYAPMDSLVEWEITLAAVGGRVTQGRAIGSVGSQEVLSVNAALGKTQNDLSGVWATPPLVPRPEKCQPRFLPQRFCNTIMEKVEVRLAKGLPFDALTGEPGQPDSALWARVPGHLTPSAATLAIIGDYVSGSASQPLGRRTMGRSLDHTLRMVQLKPTEWVLCDIRALALSGGYAQGIAFLWTQEGELLATASQSFVVRLWPGEGGDGPR